MKRKVEFIVYKAKTILFRGKPMQISVGSPIFRTFSDKKSVNILRVLTLM